MCIRDRDLSAHNAGENLLRFGCFIDTESVVFNKFKALDIGGFKPSYKFIVDYDFFIRFALKNDIYGSKEILSKWRIHEKQATNYMSLLEMKELNYIYWKYIKSNIKYSREEEQEHEFLPVDSTDKVKSREFNFILTGGSIMLYCIDHLENKKPDKLKLQIVSNDMSEYLQSQY